jgi:hypothetical protein
MSDDVDGRRNRSRGQLTHCRHGHPYTEDNTLWRSNGTKSCRVCHKVSALKQRRKRKPMKDWEHPDGSTNVDAWLAAYAADNNVFWMTAEGHIMNVVDALIERLDGAEGDIP